MQIEKALIDRYVFRKYTENFLYQLFKILQ